ncbi:MAG: T9SS type A sorting domain-containing protein [Ignavibacteria bacterium]|jgi:hypothetical protein|nr:T9SS type A sorting domain-containing protein [Ignavibacteria bacterium]MCU7514616.1 T9SS type A sorting domain-containing protein [Ignavibacteria bacterium]
MKRQILFILFFVLFAQSKVFLQNKNDFFPLSAGSYYLYKYNCDFSASDIEFMDFEEVKDTGWVSYYIEGCIKQDTMIIWKIKERDSVYTHHYRKANIPGVNIDTCFWTVGENFFELKESLSGDHKLTCISSYGIWDSPINIPWPFRPQLSRYKADSTPLKVDFDILTDRTTVILEQNTGLTSYHYYSSFGSNSRTSRDEKAVLIEQRLNSLNSVNEGNNFKHEYYISQNYPNPFNPTTTIRYAIASPSHVTLKIFDMLGREVAVLVNEEKPEGLYNAVWKADNVSSGVYFYELRAGSFVEKKKMMLVR